MLPVGPKAYELILTEEIGSRALYQERYQHPTWPGGLSGVTIGIGYDLGYHSHVEIEVDWEKVLVPSMIAELKRCSGVRGLNAQRLVHEGVPVTVELKDAEAVFRTKTLPVYAVMTEDALDYCEQLAPDAFGVLVSISYNRGPMGWNATPDDDRFQEMGEIGDAMAAKAFDEIPGYIRKMKRHWAEGSAVWKRRLAEAQLFEESLGT
jgi:hypothetical protein